MNCITSQNNIEKLFVKCQNNNKEKISDFVFQVCKRARQKRKVGKNTYLHKHWKFD